MYASMRLGCGGCLTVLVALLLVGAAGWSATGLLEAPETPAVAAGHDDWVSAQQKILFGRGRRGEPRQVTLTEREVTAVVARQLGQHSALPLSRVSVRLLSNGAAEVSGRLPFRTALAEVPFAAALGWLPWSDRPVWIVTRLRPRLEGGDGGDRYLALDVERFRMGRTRLPSWLPRLLLPAVALRYLSLRVPDRVDAVAIEQGRLVITLRP